MARRGKRRSMSETELLEGFLSEEQLMRALHLSRRSIYRMEAEGIPHVRLHGQKFYPTKAFNRWLQERVRQREAVTEAA